MTPSTPSISHIYALQSKLDDIFTEGVENRVRRHAETNAHGPRLGAPPRLRVLRAGRLPLEVAHLRGEQRKASTSPNSSKRLKERNGFIIDGGYGKLKGKTFRISNMGDETNETIAELIEALDACLPG